MRSSIWQGPISSAKSAQLCLDRKRKYENG
jgi:hypothetical protein